MEVNGYRQLFGYKHSSNIFFCIQQLKEIHTGLEQIEGEKMTIFIFGWTFPLL